MKSVDFHNVQQGSDQVNAGAVPEKRRTFADLFAGIVGFHLGMAAAGFGAVFASEWNARAASVYERNHGLKPVGDITKIDAKDIPDHTVLCGGFPCQPFSVSGKQRGFADTRGTLFFDIARIGKERQSEVLFLENVGGLASHEVGKTLATILATLDEIGYDARYKVINAADLGFPTARVRIYFVAFRKDLGVSEDMFRFPISAGTRTVVADCIEPLSEEVEDALTVGTLDAVDAAKAANAAKTAATSPSHPVRIGTLGKGGQGYRIYSTAGVGITLSAYGGGAAAKTGAYLVDGIVRKLNPRECANLMGFPKTFKIDEDSAQAYQQFGNSVVVGVVAAIAREIDRALTLAAAARRQSEDVVTNDEIFLQAA
jgi:DNA (cytosine-5)-methyltransferase 1